MNSCINATPSSAILCSAKEGNIKAQHHLAEWVYTEGLKYFVSRVHKETLLNDSDAQDLAGESLLEFQRALPRIQLLPRYVRRMFRNNLIRHLSRKRARRSRECLGEDQMVNSDFADLYPSEQTCENYGLNDREKTRLTISLKRLEASDELLQKIWSYRLADEPLPYRQIGAIVGMEDAALRMRMARFCKLVREECYRKEKRFQLSGIGFEVSHHTF
jgi:hypothetical protein